LIFDKPIQGGVGTCEGIIERAGLTEVLDDALHGANLAIARTQDRLFRHPNGWDDDAGARGEGDDVVIALDEALLNQFLRRGDYRMGKALAQVHRHECDNLHGLAGAGRLFDEPVGGSTANVEDKFFLIVAQGFGGVREAFR
jgi:hypothetical protein